jgi:nucleoside 2-deoxyribosyltransferase
MRVEYTNTSYLNEPTKSIFLAGPTPRSPEVASWRPAALQLIEETGFDGLVYVPEPFTHYITQVEWEYSHLLNCKVILFWVPRKMTTMPALTTNVEMGFWLAREPHKIVYGRPPDSESNRYLDWLYNKWIVQNLNYEPPIHGTLEDTVKYAVSKANI